MKIKLLITLMFTLLLASCGGTSIVSDSTDMEPGQISESEFLDSNEGGLDGTEDTGYFGTWTRTGTYVNGVLQGADPATITFITDGTYHSESSVCATAGTYEEIEDGTIAMVMNQNSCPGDIELPFKITYTYTIETDEDDVVTMTTITGPVMETYIR